MDRTPTLKSFNALKSALESEVASLYSRLGFSSLNGSSVFKVMDYLGTNFSILKTIEQHSYHSPSEEFGMKSDVCYYDIGFLMLKNQLKSLSTLQDPQKELFYDGVMGWLFYNPGEIHEKLRKESLAQTLDLMGKEGFAKEYNQMLANLQVMEKSFMNTRYINSIERKSPKVAAYSDMFSQLLDFPIRFDREAAKSVQN